MKDLKLAFEGSSFCKRETTPTPSLVSALRTLASCKINDIHTNNEAASKGQGIQLLELTVV